VRQKVSTPSVKEHKPNSGDTKELPRHELKLPLNKCSSPIFLPLDAKLPLLDELGTFLPLVGNA
jgi:hypothetical protein